MAVVVHFDDADIAAGADREEHSLIGRLVGLPPALPSVKATLARVWRPDGEFTLSPLEMGLTHILFSSKTDMQKVEKGSPWIFPKYLLVVRSWVPPSPTVAASLLWASLEVQIWGVPFECFTAKLAQRLGSALGETASPTLHRSDVSGGLYIRAEPVLDLAAPLPVEIEAGHVIPAKGHIGANCARKAELEGGSPRYGGFTVSKESGPEITENMLSRRKKRFTWLRAMSQKPSSSKVAGGFRIPRPPADNRVLVAQMGDQLGHSWEDTQRPRPGRVGERLQLLSLTVEPAPVSDVHPANTEVDEGMIDADNTIPSPPAAKRAKHDNMSLESKSRVEAASPDWSHGDP
ncbi:unnamed protein product [Linum trigynum]|uniref:DUF4283 domain-containing protein n=1 Tax=Linum trigynum TaxID=586398 RepID=A0AAV2EXM9_9ROSI